MAREFHPDNLIENKTYLIKFRTAEGKVLSFKGKFKRMEVQFGVLWLCFIEKSDEYPYDAESIISAKVLSR